MPNETTTTAASPSGSTSEPVIITIPEKFYGAALKARIEEKAKSTAESPLPKAEPAAPSKRGWLLPVLIGLVLLAGVAGGFVYFNRDLLFKPAAKVVETPPPEPPKPPPLPPVPAGPTGLYATATAPGLVSLNWTDASENEAGFRLERGATTSSFASLTSLPPNSTAYQDISVQPSKSYVYRVFALNAGGESLPSNEAPVTTPAPPPPPPEVPKLPPAGLDSDSDGLTDLEEPLYGTNPKEPDADKDSFLDGNEVFHLYNPAGKQGVTLLQSGLVKVFESAVGWRILVPVTWQVKLENDGQKGTIITGHGEMFTLTVEDNAAKQPLLDWYLAKNPGVLSSQVASIRTKSGYDGLEGADQLTAYFIWGSRVLVFHYDLDDQPFVNFRTTFEMMKNSLSLTAAPSLPSAPSAAPVTPVSPPVGGQAATTTALAPVEPSAPTATSP